MKRGLLKRGNKGLKSTNTLKNNSVLKNGKKINYKSSKQVEIDEEYFELKVKYFNSEELCTGCQSRTTSTPSHLIPRSRRRDLICNINNIKPHCHICHPKWESKKRVELLDYKENMEVIKELDIEYYHLLKQDETS